MSKSVRYLNGYRLIYKPDSLSAMTNDNWRGYVYEHIYVMEQSLNRSLNDDEVVHHLDCNRSNNRLNNLLLLGKGMHAKLHLWIDSGAFICESYKQNGMNSGKSKVIEPTYCAVCGLTLQDKQYNTCSIECNSIFRVKQNSIKRGKSKPSKKELAECMKTMSWLAIGRKYNISDNGARKWARQYELL